MILKPEKRIIRFGLGSQGKPVSLLWRLWVQGNETYFAVRDWTGVSRASLHSTGQWLFTTGSASIPLKGQRAIRNGWKAGPRVVFVGVPPKKPLVGFERGTAKRMFLFEPPPEGSARDFVLFFSSPSAGDADLLHMLPHGTEIIGPLELRSGDRVWLATFIVPLSVAEIGYIREKREKFRVHVTGDTKGVLAVNALLVQDSVEGDTMLLNIPLGEENIVATRQ